MLNRDRDQGAKFFTGVEVEHTPAYNRHTLFVVGIQSVSDIQDWLDDFASYEDRARHIEHIYFGANMSFPSSIRADDAVFWRPWTSMVQYFLDQGHLCTLDVDIQCVTGLLETGLCEYHNFIPMISAKLPYIDQLGYNATIKLDDTGFRATNPGVWCHSVHDLKNRRVFTDWSKYTKDTEL